MKLWIIVTEAWNGTSYTSRGVEFAGWTEADAEAALKEADERKMVKSGMERVYLEDLEVPAQGEEAANGPI